MARPPLEAAKRLILQFASKLVPKRFIKGFDLIMSPCCDVVVTKTEIECVGGGIYNIVFTLNQKLYLQGRGIAFLVDVDNIKNSSLAYYVDGSGKIVFNNTDLSGITPGTGLPFSVEFLFVTRNSNEINSLAGSVVVAPITGFLDIPSCP